MKILHLVHSMDMKAGGLSASLRQLSPESNTILTLDDPDSEFLIDIKATVVAFGPASGKFGYVKGLVDWISNNLIFFDGVVIHGLWQYHGLAYLLAKKRKKIPHFLMPHGMLDPWFWKAYFLKGLKKLLYWFLIERWLFKSATGVFYTAEAEKRKAQWLSGICRGSQKVVAYGIYPPLIERSEACEVFYKKYPQLKEKRIVLFLSRLHPKKGVHWLLEAWQKVSPGPEWELVIAGPCAPSEKKYVETLKERFKLQHNQPLWIDYIGGDEKWGAFAASEAFILPSQQENFGVAVVEALAMGTPVAISSSIDIHEVIAREGLGWVAPASLEGTVLLLQKIISLSPSERAGYIETTIHGFNQFFNLTTAHPTMEDRVQEFLQSPVRH